MMVSRSRIASILVLTIATYLASGHVISREYDPDSKVGDPCRDGSGCSGYTECSSYMGPGYCTCRAGFKPDDALNCVAGVEVVGDPCKIGVGCEQIQNSECSSNSTDRGKCICSSGFHGDDGSATCTRDPYSKVGDPCTDESGCYGNTECFSNVGPGHCTCKAGFKPDDQLNCIQGAEVVGNPCINGVGCEQLMNSECSSRSSVIGKCICKSGFHGDDGTSTCTKGAEVVGDPCKHGVGCEQIQNSECSNTSDEIGNCICAPGYHGDYGSATCTRDPESKVGDPCTDGGDCYGNTKCFSNVGPGYCTCKAGFKPDDQLNCIQGAEVVGDPCKHGVGCEQIQNSECSSTSDEIGNCICSPGYHGDDGSETSTRDFYTNVGDPCTDGGDCYGNTECTSRVGPGYCTCKTGYKPDDQLNCIQGVEVVGNPCINGVGCEQIQHSECSSTSDEIGNCICAPGYHGDDGSATCTRDPVPTKLGDSCKTASDCNGNTECTPAPGPGTCTCKDGYHADDTLSCVEGDAIIGSACIHNLGCEKVPGLKCNGTDDQGKCTCNDGFHADGEERNCIQDVGSPCNPFVGCFDPAAECKMNQMGDYTCQCREGFEAIGNICKRMDSGLHIRVHVEEAKDIDFEMDKF